MSKAWKPSSQKLRRLTQMDWDVFRGPGGKQVYVSDPYVLHYEKSNHTGWWQVYDDRSETTTRVHSYKQVLRALKKDPPPKDGGGWKPTIKKLKEEFGTPDWTFVTIGRGLNEYSYDEYVIRPVSEGWVIESLSIPPRRIESYEDIFDYMADCA